MKAANYRDMSMEDLLEQEDRLRTELFNLRVGNLTKELQNTASICEARRNLARVLTMINEAKRRVA